MKFLTQANSMRSFLFVVVLLSLIGPLASQAQTSSASGRMTTDGAVEIGRSFTSISIPAPATNRTRTAFAKTSGSDLDIIDEVVWFSFKAGTDSAYVAAQILPESIRFVGNCDSADQVSTPEIFQAIAQT